MARKLYDPIIPPEKKISAEKLAILEAQKGSFKIIRHGEQYFCTCTCGAVDVTSEPSEMMTFSEEHRLHAKT